MFDAPGTKGMTDYPMGKAGTYDDLGPAARSALHSILFQPKVDLSTKRYCGVEALSRWQPDQTQPPWLQTRGGVSVPDTDEYCQAYDYVVLSSVLNLCGRWSPALRSRAGTVSVNITGPTLSSAWLAPFIKRCLSTRGLPRLTIELTETFAITNETSALKTMQTLSRYGVAFSIDDFLTGFNQQPIFARLPFEELKVDRQDVQNLSTKRGSALVAQIVSSAKARGATVVAEGIENPAQLELAKASGCAQGQGFCISQPLTESDFVNRLAQPGDHPWAATEFEHAQKEKTQQL